MEVIVHAPLIRVRALIETKHYTFSTPQMTTPRKRLVQKINPTRGAKGHLSSEERSMLIHALLSGEQVSTLASFFRFIAIQFGIPSTDAMQRIVLKINPDQVRVLY